jgi:glutamate/tyrosine decarboxylase-like PLP-dependent enzyme
MVVATAGTTAAGMVDPIPAVADVAARRGAWLHVDAAWGGAAMFSERLKPALQGIERADSVRWDAHKWLSVPMGAGMIFCRHPEAVHRAFAVHTSYMPPESGSLTADPYAVTAQWSRRAIGLKLFLPLAELGVAGSAQRIEHQAAMGDALREQLRAAGWVIVNDTTLPVVNFTHADVTSGRVTTRTLLDAIYARGNVWIADVVLGAGTERVFRACITSFHTTPEDVAVLVAEVERARSES